MRCAWHLAGSGWWHAPGLMAAVGSHLSLSITNMLIRCEGGTRTLDKQTLPQVQARKASL